MLRTAAFAGDPFHASASTTAPVVPSTAVAGRLITGGLRSAARAEPTSRQISAAASPPPRSENSLPTLIALVPSDLGTPSLNTCHMTPTTPNAAPTTVGAISAATWVRRGPPAAATQARAAAGSAVSMDRVSHASTGTSISADHARPGPSPAPSFILAPPRPNTPSAYSTAGAIHRYDLSSSDSSYLLSAITARPPVPARCQRSRSLHGHRPKPGWHEHHQAASARPPDAPAGLARDRQRRPIPPRLAALPRPRPRRPWLRRRAPSTPHQGRAARYQAAVPARPRPSAPFPLTYGATGRPPTPARRAGRGTCRSPMPGQCRSAREPGRCATGNPAPRMAARAETAPAR